VVLESDHTYTILKPLGFCLKTTRIGKSFTHLLIFGFYFVFKLKLKYNLGYLLDIIRSKSNAKCERWIWWL